MTETKERTLIARLLQINHAEDRAQLAALRSGRGKKPGTASAMWPIMAEYLPTKDTKLADAMFIAASLFGYHRVHSSNARSFGNSLRMADPNHADTGLERRLIALLDADPEDVQRHLEAIFFYVEKEKKPVDYDLLIQDLKILLSAPSEKRDGVRQRWARQFWCPPKATDDSEETESDNEDKPE